MIVGKKLILLHMGPVWKKKRGQQLLFCILLLLLSACAARKEDTIAVQEVRRENNPANYKAIDTALHLLKDGDLVLRTGADATSYMLRQMNKTNKTYSHCGIVMVENGYPFVYHSIGGEDNPDSKLRRDSASFFFSPVSNERFGVARLDINKEQIGRLHDIVRDYYKKAIPFDMSFDLFSDDKFYCAEFVYKSVRAAVADTAYFAVTRVAKKTYVGVDNLYDGRHAKIICDVQFK